MNAWSIAFSPTWPLPWLGALAALALVVVALTAWRRPGAAFARAAVAALLRVGLLDPALQREARDDRALLRQL